jgi:hypothetical protein
MTQVIGLPRDATVQLQLVWIGSGLVRFLMVRRSWRVSWPSIVAVEEELARHQCTKLYPAQRDASYSPELSQPLVSVVFVQPQSIGAYAVAVKRDLLLSRQGSALTLRHEPDCSLDWKSITRTQILHLHCHSTTFG